MAWAFQLLNFTLEERQQLRVYGFDRHELLARAFAEDESFAVFTFAARDLFPQAEDGGERLWELWYAARDLTSTTPGRIAAVSPVEIEVWAAKRARLSPVLTEASRAAEQRIRPPAGASSGPKWPTMRRKRMAAAQTAAARETVEAEELERWTEVLVGIAEAAKLPLAVRLTSSAHSGLLGKAMTRGLRVTTLRKRARDANRMVSFMRQAHGGSWPRDAEDLLDYISSRASEPCGKSVLPSVQAAVYFLEKGGGVPVGQMLSKDPLIENVIEGLQSKLVAGSLGAAAAPREPLIFTALRERAILAGELPPYQRAYAWWKNVQSWATLRFADHGGLSPSSLRMSGGALRGELLRTKTTGSDKKSGSRAFIVAGGCYLESPEWLRKGFDLWQSWNTGRDYLLAMPAPDFEGVLPVEVGYVDACAMTRALHGGLKVQVDDLPTSLLIPSLSSFWTEHSPRHNVPSWASSVVDVSEDQVSLLGGWVLQGTAPRYVATAERKIRLIQEETAARLRESKGGADLVDEDQLFHQLRTFMGERGISIEDQDAQISRLLWAAPESIGEDFPPEKVRIEELNWPDDEGSPNWSPEPEAKYAGLLPDDLVGQYSVSIGQRSGHRCLHLLGSCHRVPELHYRCFEIYPSRPSAAMYDDFCRHCWPQGTAAADIDDPAGDSATSSSED